MIKVSQKLIVIICKANGAISIFRRNFLLIHDEKPLVEIYGIPWLRSVTGLNVGFVEHVTDEFFSQTYVFISKSFPSKDSIP